MGVPEQVDHRQGCCGSDGNSGLVNEKLWHVCESEINPQTVTQPDEDVHMQADAVVAAQLASLVSPAHVGSLG